MTSRMLPPGQPPPRLRRSADALRAKAEGGSHIAVAVVAILLALANAWTAAQPKRAFAGHVAALSEPGGYFDTDNLVSNERSYLEVVPELQRAQVSGGAYVGVGPDQNFSYIAAVHPDVAFIVDIRRDNLLLHLLFKALFDLSRTRVEYVSLLFGRETPRDLSTWRRAPVDRLVGYVQRPRAAPIAIDAQRKRIEVSIRRFGVPLSAQEFATVERFRRRFIEAGMDLRFQSTGRAPQSYYPTYGELLAETDPSGHQANFLASEDAFQFVRNLEARDLIIPVVGDVSGSSAMTGIGKLLADRHQRLSAFYISNVERYLFRDGSFERFVKNLSAIPHGSNAVLIRSVFGRYSMGWGGSTSQLQRIDDLLDGFAAGRFRDYDQVIMKR